MLHTTTIAVPLHKQATVESKLNEFAKKAKKYGFVSPQAEWGDTFFDRIAIDRFETVKIEFIKLTLKFEPIVAPGGWNFVAMVEKTEAGNLISGSLSDQLKHLRTSELSCGHCRQERNRKKYYVLVNESGQKLILGSTCVKDYFGLDPAGAIESMYILNWMRQPEGLDDDLPSADYYAVELEQVAALTVAFVRRIGFVSAQEARESELTTPTWREVNSQLMFLRGIQKQEQVIPTDDEKAISKQILDRWETTAESIENRLEQADEWDYRKYLFVRNGYVTPLPEQMAVAIGVIAREYKQIGIEAERAIAGQSAFFGMPQQREQFELLVTRIQTSKDGYGTTEMISGVLNGTPNRFVWWNSGRAGQLNEGVIRVKATVKEHSETDEYGRQTILNRVSLVKS